MYNPVATSYHTSLALDDYDREPDRNKVGDFFQYGITSSIASGAMSFVNTGAAVANFFGADFEYNDTKDVLSAMGLDQTAQYYDENRGAMDMIGLVAGSFIPGLGGVRAAQAIKRGVQASNSSSRIVMGLKNTVYPTSQSKKYAEQVMKQGTYNTKPYQVTLDAAKEGFREQAIETAFAEAAIMLTMNQNPLIGNEDLEYFTAIKDNAGSMGLGFLMGTGISGTIATAMGTRALRNIIQTPLREVNELSPSRVTRPDFAVRGEVAGDQLSKLAADRDATRQALEARLNGDVKATALTKVELEKRLEAQDKIAREWINELTKPNKRLPEYLQEDATTLNEALFQVWKNGDAQKLRESLGGLQRVNLLGEESLLMDTSLSPLTFLDMESSPDALRQFYREGVDKHFAERLKDGRISPEEYNARIDEYVESMYRANGMTIPGLAWGNNASVTAVWDDPSLSAAQKIFIARHEIGHNKTDRLAKFWNSKLAEPIKKEATELSRKARPQQWAEADRYREILELSPEELAARNIKMEDLNEMRKWVDYMEMPEEILADAWAMLDGALEEVKLDSMLYKTFANNSAAKSFYGSNEMVMDTLTGDLTKVAKRVPTVRDLGKVSSRSVKIGKQDGAEVTHAEGRTKFAWTDEFDVGKETYISASAKYHAAVTDTKPLPRDIKVDATNLPQMLRLITRASKPEGNKLALRSNVELTTADGKSFRLDFTQGVSQENLNILRKEQLRAKASILNTVRNRETGKFGELEIARILDLNDGSEIVNTLQGLLNSPNTAELLTQPQTLRSISFSEAYDPRNPTAAKLSYQADRVKPADVKELADVELRYRRNLELKSEQVDSFYARQFGDRIDLPQSSAIATGFKSNAANEMTDATPVGGFVTAVQGDYDFISFVQQVGSQHRKAIQLGNKKIVDEVRPAAERVKRSSEALMEVAVLDSFLRKGKFKEIRNARAYADDLNAQAAQLQGKHGESVREILRDVVTPALRQLDGQGNSANLWSTKLSDAIEDLMTKQRVTKRMRSDIERMIDTDMKGVKSRDVADLFRSSGNMRQMFAEADSQIAGFEGRQAMVDPDVWYPGPADVSRYKHVAFIIPKKQGLMANNQKSIVGAPDEEAFQVKMQQIRQKFGDDVRIVTPQDTADFKRLKGEYDAELSFNEYNINSSMSNRGIFSDLAPEPTPQVVDHYVNSLGRTWKRYNDAMFKHKYHEEVNILEQMHQAKVSGLGTPASTPKRKSNETVSNPRKALDIMFNNANKDFESYTGMQQSFDRGFSKVANTIGQMFKRAKEPVDFKKMNDYMEQYGLPKVYDEGVRDYLVRTEAVNDQLLASWIPRINSAASTLMLRWDYVQPIVNVLSVPILAHPEMAHLRKQLPKLQQEQFMRNTSVQIPGTDQRMPSTLHLQMQATKDWFNSDIRKRYENLDLLGNMAREQREAIDLLTVSADQLRKGGSELESTWRKAAGKISNIVAKPADLSEEFSKFMGARMAELMLDAAGVVDQSLRAQTMRTFTTRIVGNYNAAQRPGLFQGHAGQMFGLFQTYQFNLIQQLLRHVGDSPRRGAAMMGIQAGIFGTQSVPGFQILNNHIAEKSDWENDFFTGFNDTFGSSVGEWIVYGAASNLTRPIFGDGMELYTRGDLNPRTPILVPTSFDEVPAISMATNFLSSIANSANKIGEGAPVGAALLEGLATNGMNRPLQGIAQLAQGARLSNRGTLLATTEDLNMAQRAMRIMGSRGLDESIAVNAFYRAQKYESARQEQISNMGMAARTSMRAGEYSPEMHYSFMNRYVEYGGDLDNYTTWMHNNAVNATEGQLWQMSERNNSVVGKYLQTLMGGEIESYVGSWHRNANTRVIGRQPQGQRQQQQQRSRLNFQPGQ